MLAQIDLEWPCSRAVAVSTTDDANKINRVVGELFPGEKGRFCATVIPSLTRMETFRLQQSFFKALSSNLPPCVSKRKCDIMLHRDLDPARVLLNGQRYYVMPLKRKHIVAAMATPQDLVHWCTLCNPEPGRYPYMGTTVVQLSL